MTLEAQGGAVVIVLTHQGDKAGGIASASTNRLRECIELGTVYEATVTSISGGQVQVRIKAVRH
ncbi:hypothetical protein [Novilysobacter selenitireducens]|uniref:TRAM domain-containing protein n=1 Tax=Novilysobacter selenitireducens TaxID=2872639 RepID=A0ABS7T2I2_9GAMM|nr:hypothetical protein [Lysobacter selenitireducens]MBZ4038070.1 hypothetical protein [Lysobacter selenitireducens]